MTFFSKILWTVKSAVLSLLISTDFQSSQFIYLNNPETITQTGVLHNKKITKDTKIRYFFHYKNGTKDNQKFTIKNNKEVKNLKKSINICDAPEVAGYLSAEGFLRATKKDTKINFNCTIKPDETVSGILEGNFYKGDEILYKFGSTDNKIDTINIAQQEHNYSVLLALDKKRGSTYRLGDGIPGTIRGQYGHDIIVEIKPKDTGWMKISFSPRGGTGALVFENKGKVYSTDFEPAKTMNEATMIYVEKDKTEYIRFIPFGGLNYPILLNFTIVEGYNSDIA